MAGYTGTVDAGIIPIKRVRIEEFQPPKSLEGWIGIGFMPDGTVLYAFNQDRKALRVNRDVYGPRGKYAGFAEIVTDHHKGRVKKGEGVVLQITHRLGRVETFFEVERIGYLGRDQKEGIVERL